MTAVNQFVIKKNKTQTHKRQDSISQQLPCETLKFCSTIISFMMMIRMGAIIIIIIYFQNCVIFVQ